MIITIILIMIAFYTFLEFYHRSQNIKVTWYDRVIGGIGGILLLIAMWNIVGTRESTTDVRLLILITGLPAVVLMMIAWLSIVRRR
jgi:uncharacterized membrane protein